jgi:Transposase IS116/IS110/IS902 family
MHSINNTELSSLEETRCQFNGGRCAIKLGIDVHQDFYVVVEQEPAQNWWKPHTFAALDVPQWMRELLLNCQPILVALQQKIAALTLQLQSAAAPNQPRGLGKMTSVVIDRDIGDWRRFNNRRQIPNYTGLCPGEHSSGNTRLQSCVTKHGNPRLRAAPWWSWPGDWCASSPTTNRSSNGDRSWPRVRWPPVPHAKKPSWP